MSGKSEDKLSYQLFHLTTEDILLISYLKSLLKLRETNAPVSTFRLLPSARANPLVLWSS